MKKLVRDFILQWIMSIFSLTSLLAWSFTLWRVTHLNCLQRRDKLHLTLGQSFIKSFLPNNSLLSFSSNEEPTECCRRRRSGKNSLTLEYRKRATATYRGLSHSPNSEGGSDENESSSGFGEDDSAIPINQCEAGLNDDSYQTVSPQTVVESVQVIFLVFFCFVTFKYS